MTIDEVFSNPTVKQVLFQIRFPNLFYIESKIGEYQLKIMKRFPESSMAFRRNFLIAEFPAEVKPEIKFDENSLGVKKVWTFKSTDEISLNVHSDSLDISSTTHKTYNNKNHENRFRDVIEQAVEPFIELTGIPIITRIGLRYIDECPVKSMTNEFFSQYYNSTFPKDRFPISDGTKFEFKTQTKKGEHFLSFRETLTNDKEGPKYQLDFDGYSENIDSEKYLEVTDSLHDIIIKEYEASIKEPVFEYMRSANR